MKVQCFTQVDAKQPAKEYEARGVTSNTIDPFHHELVLDIVDGKTSTQKLIQVHGAPRQGTSPERYAAVRVLNDDDSVFGTYSIDGRTTGEVAVEEPDAEVAEPQDMTPEEREAFIVGLNDRDLNAELRKHNIKPEGKKADRQELLRKAMAPIEVQS